MTDIDKLSGDHFGLWAALGTGVTTSIAFVIAVLTPPLSGPLCRAGCLRYPYLDIAPRFPRDYYWMFPATLSMLFFLALMVALARRVHAKGHPLTELGLLVAGMGGLVLVGNYFVQLAVVQPSLLSGETDGISLFTQYNPHGVFIALEELGYLLISLSMVCMIPALSRASALERFVRRLFLGSLVLNVSAFAFFLYRYGNRREYRFEVAVISIDWLAMIAAGFVMAVVFSRGYESPGATTVA